MRDLVRDLIPWVGRPLLVAARIAGVCTPAFPQGVGEKPGRPPQLETPAGSQPSPAVPGEIQDLKDQIRRLEDRERQNYLLVLEGERKTIDRWFSFLAVVTAVLAVFGAAIPYLMGRKDKEIIEHDMSQIRNMKESIASDKRFIEQLKKDMEGHVQSAKADATEIQLLKEYNNDTQLETAEANKTEEAVKTVQQDPTTSPSLGLRAMAIEASQARKPQRAHRLWSALAELEPNDASAQFNAA